MSVSQLQRVALYLCVFLGFSQGSWAQPRAALRASTDLAAPKAASAIDVSFYHVDVEVDLENPFFKGATKVQFKAKTALSAFALDLHQEIKVDAVDGAASFTQEGNTLNITLNEALTKNQTASVTVHYQAKPPIVVQNGRDLGLIYDEHGKGKVRELVIASVTYPLHAHLWIPCVESSQDKADSSYVDITIRDTTIQSITRKDTFDLPVIAVSNGIMYDQVKVGKHKTKYRWRHRYPIAPHHIGIAISNYKKLENTYTSPYKEKYPLIYYVFAEHERAAKVTMRRMPEIMTCLSNTFGKYPYNKEKFGYTQVGFQVGENGSSTQTNPFVPDLQGRHMPVSVHEATRMWFGNSITYSNFQHAWLPEAMASYAEAIWQEYRRGPYAYFRTLQQKEYYEQGSLYIEEEADLSIERFNKKGAHVLHMLRGIMGDDYFYQSMRAFAQDHRYKYKSVITEDFQKICEYYASENVEQDYSYFFKDWVYGEGVPHYFYSFEHKRGDLQVTIGQNKLEGNTPEFFTMPIELKIIFEDDSYVEEKVFNDKPLQRFSFAYDKDVKDVIFDPDKWILKKMGYKHKIENTKAPILDFELEISENSRDVILKFRTERKQDLLIELLSKEGSSVYTKEFSKVQNKAQKAVHFNEDIVSGDYTLRITGKSDVFTQMLKLRKK